MTTEGFFSAVEDREDESGVFVRARVRGDAEKLAAAVGGTVLETPARDYRFRVRMTKSDWARYVAACATGIDYDNFKNAVAVRQGAARAGVYGEVWGVLLRLQRAAGRARKDLRLPTQETIIYGEDFEPDVIAFVPESTAKELAGLFAALRECGTWGELRERLSPERYAEIIEKRASDEERDDPEPSEPFVNDFDVFSEGDWPALPKQMQGDWMPDDVKAIGEYVHSPVSGSWTQFTAAQEDEVVRGAARARVRGAEGRRAVHGGGSAGRLDVAAEWARRRRRTHLD